MPGDQHRGIAGHELFLPGRAFRRLDEIRQRVIAPVLVLLQVEIQFARPGVEAVLLVLPELRLGLQVRHVLEFVPGHPGRLQDEVQRFLVGVPEAVLKAQFLPQFVEYDVVRPGLAGSLDHLASREHVPMHFPVIGDVVVLQPGGRGQDDVGQFGRRGPEDIGGDQELYLLQHFVHPVGVFPGRQLVAGEQHHGAHPVRIAALDGVPDHVGGDAVDGGAQLVLIAAQQFLLLFLRQLVKQGKPGPRQSGRQAEDHVAAGDVQVAGQSHQVDQGAVRVHAVDVLLDAHAPLQGRWPGGGIQPGRGDDLLLRHPGDAFHHLRREALQPFLQLVEAGRIFLNKIMIIQVFLDDDVHHTHGQRRVRGGAQLQPQVRLVGQLAAAGVDDDQSGAVSQGMGQVDALVLVRVGDQVVAAPGDHAFRLVVVIAERDVHAHDLADGDARQVAHVPRRQHVGRTVQVGDPVHEAVEIAPCAVAEHHRFSAGFPFYLVQFVGNDGQRLVPGQPPPLALAPLSDSLHGVEQAVRVFLEFQVAVGLLAGIAFADRVIPVRLDLYRLAVLDGHVNAATAVAAGAAYGPYFSLHVSQLLLSPSLSYHRWYSFPSFQAPFVIPAQAGIQ